AGNTVRFKIPVIVTLDSDVDLVARLMCEAAKENSDVDEVPEPATRLIKIEGDGMHFELRAWTTSRLGKPAVLRSDLLFSIVKRFRENGIVFADSGVLQVNRNDAGG